MSGPGSTCASRPAATFRCSSFSSPFFVSSSFRPPTSSRKYLTTVQNYRAMEVGGVLMWIALPQFLLAPVVATILRFVDPRLTMALASR